jgi:hypothetical protein
MCLRRNAWRALGFSLFAAQPSQRRRRTAGVGGFGTRRVVVRPQMPLHISLAQDFDCAREWSERCGPSVLLAVSPARSAPRDGGVEDSAAVGGGGGGGAQVDAPRAHEASAVLSCDLRAVTLQLLKLLLVQGMVVHAQGRHTKPQVRCVRTQPFQDRKPRGKSCIS